jgi:hypothetical protein
MPTSIVVLIMAVGVLIFSLFLVAAVHWHKVRESDNVTKLKLEMLHRGMSADEDQDSFRSGGATCRAGSHQVALALLTGRSARWTESVRCLCRLRVA